MSKEKSDKTFTENEDGGVTVHLRREYEMDGQKVKDVKMREPTAGDYIDADNGTRSSGQAEAIVLSNLSEFSPEAIRALPFKDYKRLQEALGFMSG